MEWQDAIFGPKRLVPVFSGPNYIFKANVLRYFNETASL